MLHFIGCNEIDCHGGRLVKEFTRKKILGVLTGLAWIKIVVFSRQPSNSIRREKFLGNLSDCQFL
jgi:hypothetical protein